MTDNAPAPGFSGTVRVRRADARLWWFVVIAANVGALVLLLLLVALSVGGAPLAGLLVGLIVWITADAVLIPIAIVRARTQLLLDFDRGTIASAGVVYPSSEFRQASHTTRHYPGRARLVSFVFDRGAVDVQLDGFGRDPRGQERNRALADFAHRWLPLPLRHRSSLPSAPGTTTELIGRAELDELLLGR